MTKLKSKWVGDSEKSVKAVFNIYRKLCQTSALAPILLFNEADAIFARRFDNPDNSVEQMENTIQNILLQALSEDRFDELYALVNEQIPLVQEAIKRKV